MYIYIYICGGDVGLLIFYMGGGVGILRLPIEEVLVPTFAAMSLPEAYPLKAFTPKPTWKML